MMMMRRSLNNSAGIQTGLIDSSSDVSILHQLAHILTPVLACHDGLDVQK